MKELPEGWEWTTLGQSTECLDSKRVPLNGEERSKIHGDIPYYGANGQVDSINNHLFDEELLLLAEDGGSWGLNEKCAYIISGKSWVNNHAHVLKMKNGIDIGFLMHFLNKNDLSKYISGSTRGKLNQKKMNKIPFPLPPLPTQHRIVAILEKAEQLKNWHTEQGKLLDDYLKSVFLEMFGDPYTNPHEWDEKQLKEVVREDKIITYGIVQAGPHVEDGIPYIKTGDIVRGKINPTGLSKTSKEIAKSYERSRVEYGDIIMSIRATVGTVALLPPELDGGNLTQGTARISPAPIVNKHYLLFCLGSVGIQTKIQKITKGATFREITLGKLRQIIIPLPPLPLQQKFASIVQRTEKLKAQHEESARQSEDLFNALMQKAFTGELVA